MVRKRVTVKWKRRIKQPKPSQSIPLHIIGPTEIDIVDIGYNQSRIVILSDEHVQTPKCPSNSPTITIWNFLSHVFRQYDRMDNKETIDFFLETAYSGTPLSKANQYGFKADDFLDDTFVAFQFCFQRIKTKCPYRKIRFHYADVRFGVEHSQLQQMDREFVKDFHFLQTCMLQRRRACKIANLYPRLELLFQKLMAKDWDYFMNLSKVSKQLNGIKDKTMAELIRFIIPQYYADDKDWNKLVKELQEPIPKVLEIIRLTHQLPKVVGDIEFRRWFDRMMGITLAPIFDMYVIGRMIRLDMKQVILFAGSAHTFKIYSFLLDYMNGKVLLHRESTNKKSFFQCMPLSPSLWFK